MLEDPIEAATDGRTPGSAHGTLLTRIQDGLSPMPPASWQRTRRCPRCGRPIRAGQRVTAIHGTSVHVTCPGASAAGQTG